MTPIDLVRVEHRGKIAVVTLANPPVNALSHALRVQLVAVLADLEDCRDVEAIVIGCAGRTFSVGADVTELNAAPRPPSTGTMMRDSFDASKKLLVFALHGQVLGGGLELALVGDLRIAAAGTRLGLPEIKLGLIPGGGGTQRLPRLIGVSATLDMILSGNPVEAAKALELGIIDAIADGDLTDAAVTLATGALHRTTRRRLSRLPPVASEEDFTKRREAALAQSQVPAAGLAVDAVQASTMMDFERGLAREAALFQEVRLTRESRALRYLFTGERTVATIPGLPADIRPRRLESTAVIGAGTMGIGVTIALLDADLPVTLVETSQASLDRGKARVAASYASLVERGKLASPIMRARLARLTCTLDLADLADVDLVIECVFEDMAIKQALFAELGRSSRAVLATNTSALDVNAIAAASGRSTDVVGMHFFSPANVMKLLEVVRAADTAPDILATAMLAARRMGKVAVVAGVCDGFIGNRMIGGYLREAGLLLLEGAAPEQIDGALRRFGMAMGPHAMGDLAGLDIQAAARARRRAEGTLTTDPRIGAVADALVAAGRFGLKTGRGIYTYKEGSRTPLPDPEVAVLIAAEQERFGIRPRSFGDAEIVDRCILPLVNEAAHILREGIALGPVDIDVVYANGYGFPRSKGGPTFWADTQGLGPIVDRIEAIQRSTGSKNWQIAPLLAELVSQGRSFADLPRG